MNETTLQMLTQLINEAQERNVLVKTMRDLIWRICIVKFTKKMSPDEKIQSMITHTGVILKKNYIK